MNGFDLSTISNCYVGGVQANSIYYGSQLIWPTGPGPGPHDYSQDYFTIEAISSGSIYINYTNASQLSSSKYISYNKNNGPTWYMIDMSTASWNSTTQIGKLKIGDFVTGDKIRIKSNGWSHRYYNYSIRPVYFFTGSADISVYGNIMSLLCEDNFTNQYDLSAVSDTDHNTFYELFVEYNENSVHNNGGKLISVENLILPATTLVRSCYDSMFKNCTTITKTPVLPATILVTDCYSEMFYGCTSLNYVKCYATDITASGCLALWLNNVSSTGTFYKDANTTYPSGTSGIPSGWIIENIQ